MIIGGRGWQPDAREKIQQFSKDWNLRVVAEFCFQGSLQPLYSTGFLW